MLGSTDTQAWVVELTRYPDGKHYRVVVNAADMSQAFARAREAVAAGSPNDSEVRQLSAVRLLDKALVIGSKRSWFAHGAVMEVV